MSSISTRTPSGGYGQDWPAYHSAQVNEKELFHLILHEICKEVEEPQHVTGRIPHSMQDMVFCIVDKVYSTRSSRRFISELKQVKAEGLIETVPGSNSLSEYLRKESLTDILKLLITKSSLPVAGREHVFAADSTGLSLPHRRIFFNRHTGRREMRRDYLKLHVMIGTGTNIITCAETSEGAANDRPFLKGLVEGTARYFEISEVSADAGYTSGENYRIVLLAGAIPYIAFSKKCALDADYKSTFWKDMLYLHKTRHPLFTERYFLRNNVEATFSSMKAKFGGRVRSKSQCGQFNEALCKVLCHNICVLIQSMYELGINPTSWTGVKPRPEAEAGLTGEGLKNRQKELENIRIAAAPRQDHIPEEISDTTQKSEEVSSKPKNREVKQTSLFETSMND